MFLEDLIQVLAKTVLGYYNNAVSKGKLNDADIANLLRDKSQIVQNLKIKKVAADEAKGSAGIHRTAFLDLLIAIIEKSVNYINCDYKALSRFEKFDEELKEALLALKCLESQDQIITFNSETKKYTSLKAYSGVKALLGAGSNTSSILHEHALKEGAPLAGDEQTVRLKCLLAVHDLLIKKLSAYVKKGEAEAKVNKQHLAEIKGKLQEAKNRVGELSTKLEAATAKLNGQGKFKQTLETDRESLLQKVTDLSAQLQTKTKEVEALTKNVAGLKTQLAETEAKLTDATTQNNAKDNRIVSLQDENGRLQTAFVQKDQEIERLKRKLQQGEAMCKQVLEKNQSNTAQRQPTTAPRTSQYGAHSQQYNPTFLQPRREQTASASRHAPQTSSNRDGGWASFPWTS